MLLNSNTQPRRIGLVSPYSGGNLGNTAIIEAMVANIRNRIPDAEIIGITLNPSDTSRRFGIRGFPLAALSRPYYTLVTEIPGTWERSRPPKLGRIKQIAKQIPLLSRTVRAIRSSFAELAHTRAALRLARTLDQLIITGGGALDDSWGGPWGHPWSLFKWSLISQFSGASLLFVSVGKSYLERPLSRLFVRHALSRAVYRSYRDNESKISMRNLINSDNDPVCPDLAFSHPSAGLYSSGRHSTKDERLVVGISPIAYCDPRVWPLKDSGRYSDYLAKFAKSVEWLIKENCLVVMFTTDSPDIITAHEIMAIMSGSPGISNSIETLPCSTDQEVEGFLKSISRVDLSIASRLHGVILSHLNATPVLALSFDPKVDAHMKAMQQGNYCLNINDWSPEVLIDRFNTLKAVRNEERTHLKSTVEGFRQRLDAQYDRFLGPKQLSSAPSADEGRRAPRVPSTQGAQRNLQEKIGV